MGTILSKRGRDAKAKADLNRRLEEKFLTPHPTRTPEEHQQIRRVFDEIRRQLDILGKGGAHA